MKAHCDRCEKLIEDYTNWVEERNDNNNYVWHIDINPTKSQQFCKECTIIILEFYIKAIQ